MVFKINIVDRGSVTYDRLYTDHFSNPANRPQPIYTNNPKPGSSFCEVLPDLKNLQQLNLGSQAYADNLIGYNFVAYKGQGSGEVHGYTNTGVASSSWAPTIDGLNFNFALRRDPTQDIFHPALNVFNNQFGIAWIESSQVGINKLNYAELPISRMKNYSNISGNDLYVYPNINPVYRKLHKENVPYNKLTVINSFDERFPLDSYQYDVGGHGFNVSMKGSSESVRFVQDFRQKATTLNVRLITAPTLTQAEGYIASQPIPNYPINIYYGETNKIFKHGFTNYDGTFTVILPAGFYSFEVLTLNDSVIWQQRIV